MFAAKGADESEKWQLVSLEVGLDGPYVYLPTQNDSMILLFYHCCARALVRLLCFQTTLERVPISDSGTGVTSLFPHCRAYVVAHYYV